MQSTLAKPWGKHPPGTIITTEGLGEAPEGALRVNGRRFEALQDGGFFAGFPSMELPIPAPPPVQAASQPGPAPFNTFEVRGFQPPPPLAPAKKKEGT